MHTQVSDVEEDSKVLKGLDKLNIDRSYRVESKGVSCPTFSTSSHLSSLPLSSSHLTLNKGLLMDKFIQHSFIQLRAEKG